MTTEEQPLPTTQPVPLLAQVWLAREGSAVERCHVQPHSLRYSVGHHSLDMITLLTLAWKADHAGCLPRAELLIAAAFHDVPEAITGDLPSPSKRLGGPALAGVEQHALEWLGMGDCYEALTDEEQLYLDTADAFELWLWCSEEVHQRGNNTFKGWLETAFRPTEETPASFRELYTMVDLLKSPRMTWEGLARAGGLWVEPVKEEEKAS